MRIRKDDKDMKKIVTAIVGYGFSGSTFHLPPLKHNEQYDIKLVMTRSEHNQAQLKKDYPKAQIVTSYEEILNDKDVDLIVIATSNAVHYSYTKDALLKGKHVVCEKPFVETYNLAKELYDLAAKKGLILRVFHNRKYDGDILTLHQLVKDKNFGEIVSYETRFDQYRPEIGSNWRFKKVDMAGNFYDLAPHLVHHVVSLFGLPQKVYNKLFYDRKGSYVDDHFEMVMYYENGPRCYLGAEMLDRAPKPRQKLVGTKASYVKYEFDVPDTVDYKPENLYQDRQMRSDFIEDPSKPEHINVLKGQHYKFYEVLAKDINDRPKEDEDKKLALSVILVMEMAMKSSLLGEEVDVPQIIK